KLSKRICVANHQLLVVWARFLPGLQVNLMRIRTGAKRPIDLPKLIATQIGEVNRSLRSRSDSQIWLRLQPRCVICGLFLETHREEQDRLWFSFHQQCCWSEIKSRSYFSNLIDYRSNKQWVRRAGVIKNEARFTIQKGIAKTRLERKPASLPKERHA